MQCVSRDIEESEGAARKAGRIAEQAGQPFTANPNTWGSDLWDCWYAGWKQADQETTEAARVRNWADI